MAEAQMFDRILQLMHRFGQKHRQKPKAHRRPWIQSNRAQEDHRIERHMNPALKNDLGLFFGADKRLNNHPPRAADHTKDAIAPIRNAGQPQ